MTGEYPLFRRRNIDMNFLRSWNFNEKKLRLHVGVSQQQWWEILLKTSMETAKAVCYTRYLLFRGCLSIEVNGRTVGTFRIVSYIVSVHC